MDSDGFWLIFMDFHLNKISLPEEGAVQRLFSPWAIFLFLLHLAHGVEIFLSKRVPRVQYENVWNSTKINKNDVVTKACLLVAGYLRFFGGPKRENQFYLLKRAESSLENSQEPI